MINYIYMYMKKKIKNLKKEILFEFSYNLINFFFFLNLDK
jgi:hypothetical protein